MAKHHKKEHEKKEHEKKKHMKSGGHADGKKSEGHVGKYARGGATMASAKMTPESPLSGAGKMSKTPKAIGTDKDDD
jgi:hypothetical protein